MLETACFPFRVHCTAPRWSTFQGVSRSFDVILVKDFANSIDILLVWQSFYSGINSHTSKIMSIQSLVCWNEIRDVLFLKRPFENQAFFFSKIQHTLFEIYSPLIVMYFENRNWHVVRLKWFFSWFFVSILDSDFGYIFWWYAMRWPSVNFKENKRLKVKTWGFIKKDCFLF
jgi:hypothetical protein